ncbi:hypothetical protein C8J56DRAFT_888431 [Mycena floridula]|nr:hypothetical protein C8J56DRAFT_888431 [Mycena floridula]
MDETCTEEEAMSIDGVQLSTVHVVEVSIDEDPSKSTPKMDTSAARSAISSAVTRSRSPVQSEEPPNSFHRERHGVLIGRWKGSARNSSDPWLVRVYPAEFGELVQNMFWQIMSAVAGRPCTLPADRPVIYAKFPVDPVMVTYRPVVMFFQATQCIYHVETNILLVMPDIIVEEERHKVYSVIADEGMLVG